jgi:5-methylcytosine-specific restriction endonuclease McrA
MTKQVVTDLHADNIDSFLEWPLAYPVRREQSQAKGHSRGLFLFQEALLMPYLTDYQRKLFDEGQVPHWDSPKFHSAVSSAQRLSIFTRDFWTCVYCGSDAEHLDHVIPKSRGGRRVPINLVAACAFCNISKWNQTPEEWRSND